MAAGGGGGGGAGSAIFGAGAGSGGGGGAGGAAAMELFGGLGGSEGGAAAGGGIGFSVVDFFARAGFGAAFAVAMGRLGAARRALRYREAGVDALFIGATCSSDTGAVLPGMMRPWGPAAGGAAPAPGTTPYPPPGIAPYPPSSRTLRSTRTLSLPDI